MENSGALLEWDTVEYIPKKKAVDWYWGIGIIAICTTIASLIYKNFLFAVFIVVSSLSIVLFQIKKPTTLHVEVFAKGIRIGNYFYSFETMKSFWIEEDNNRLLINSDRMVLPMIIVPLENVDIDRLRQILAKRVKEKEISHSAINKLIDRLGF